MVWVIDSLAGGSLISKAPVFTANEKYFFLCQGVNIRMYETSSLKVVRTLTGHKNTVTLCQLCKSNNLQLYSSSLDGTIRVWDIMDGKCLKVLTIHETKPVLAFEQHPQLANNLFVCLGFGEKKRPHKWTIQEYSIDTQKALRTIVKGDGNPPLLQSRASGPMIENTSTPEEEKMDLDSDSESDSEPSGKRKKTSHMPIEETHDRELSMLVIVTGHLLYLYSLDTGVLLEMNHKNVLTTVAIHPKENCIATGDQVGEIVLWYLNEKSKAMLWKQDRRPGPPTKIALSTFGKSKSRSPSMFSTTTLHWHAHGVNHLVFNASGTLLYSVGTEGVLVHWSMKTFDKGFLPRICDGLQYITINRHGDQAILCGSDNSLFRINLFENKILNTTRSIGLGSSTVSSCFPYMNCGLLYDPNSHNICIPLPLTIPMFQVYDIHQDCEVYKVGSEGMNNATKTDGQKGSFRTIDNYMFSHDGQMLYIVEKWNNGSGIESNILKFYTYSVTQQDHQTCYSSTLFAQIDNPHNDHITCMCVHPQTYQIVTGCKDGSFKIWNYIHVTSPENMNESVVYTGVHTYSCSYGTTYREQPVGSCCYSADGSILAVSYGSFVTLWNTSDMSMIAVLSHPPPSYVITYLSFFQSNTYLLCATERSLFVYEVLSKQILWFVNTPVTCAASNYNVYSNQPLFATALQDPKDAHHPTVAIYRPESPIPICGYKLLNKVIAMEWGYYMENDLQLPCLYLLTSRREILCLKEVNEQDDTHHHQMEIYTMNIKNTSLIDMTNPEEDQSSAYDQVFGIDQVEKMKQELKNQQEQHQMAMSSMDFQQVINVPSHTLPVPSLLFQSYANKLLSSPQ